MKIEHLLLSPLIIACAVMGATSVQAQYIEPWEGPTFVESPTAIPSETPTETPTTTPTEMPTETVTPTETPTNIPSETPTETATPMEVPSESPTETPESSPIPTITPTETPAIITTDTPSPTPTGTPTETPTPILTETTTPTPVASPTNDNVAFYPGPILALRLAFQPGAEFYSADGALVENPFAFLTEQVTANSSEPFNVVFTPPGGMPVRYIGSCNSTYFGPIVKNEVVSSEAAAPPLPDDVMATFSAELSCVAAEGCGDFDAAGLCPVNGCGQDRKKACVLAGIGGADGKGCVCVQSYPKAGNANSLCLTVRDSGYCSRFYCTKTPGQLVGDACTDNGANGCLCKRIPCDKKAYPVCNAGCAGALCCAETGDASCACFTECNNRKPTDKGGCSNYPCLKGGTCKASGNKCVCK